MGEKVLSREELLAYFEQIKTKITAYLDNLNDEDLYEKPEGYKYNRMSCILGQIRHFYAHLGNINATTIVQTNKWPRVVGMIGLEQGLDKNNLFEE